MKEKKFIFKILTFLLFCILCLRLLGIFVVTYEKISYRGSTDLRNRIVGARIALLHKDPYTYQEPPEGNSKLLDPLIFPDSNITRLSVSPAVLLSHLGIHLLNFHQIIYVWFIVEWLVFFATLTILRKLANSQEKKCILFLGLILGGSSIWSLHLDSGQVYVLYALLLSFILYAYYSKRPAISFFLLGVLTLMRPTYIVVPLYLFLFPHYRTFLRSFICGCITIVLLTMVLFNPLVWLQYLDGMVAMTRILPQVEEEGKLAQHLYPQVIEKWSVPQDSASFSPIYENSTRNIVFRLTGQLLSVETLVVLIVSINLIILVYIYKKEINKFLPLFTIATASVIISEYFIPARRYIYSDIQWIVPLSLIIILMQQEGQKRQHRSVLCLFRFL